MSLILSWNVDAQNFAGELASLDFYHLIGNPMWATIQAQADSAQETLSFIRALTDPQTKKLSTVEFKFSKVEGNSLESVDITMPLLAIMPIPFLRIESLSIKLNVQLDSVVTSGQNWTGNVSPSPYSYFQSGWGSFYSLTGSSSTQYTGYSKSKATKSYSMSVEMEAVQGELPGGLSKLLDIMESTISKRAPSNSTQSSGQSSDQSTDDSGN